MKKNEGNAPANRRPPPPYARDQMRANPAIQVDDEDECEVSQETPLADEERGEAREMKDLGKNPAIPTPRRVRPGDIHKDDCELGCFGWGVIMFFLIGALVIIIWEWVKK